jgi:hypothetical protein
MMLNKRAYILTLTLSWGMVLALLVSAAQADVGWILQSGTNVSLSGNVGTVQVDASGNPVLDPQGNPTYLESYNVVQQTDPGTTLAAGFANSLTSSANGTFQTSGSNFLSSFKVSSSSANQLITVLTNNGSWLPGAAGAAPANAACTLHTTPAGANGGDGGRVAISNTVGNITTNNAAIPVTNGTFNASAAGITGSTQLAICYDGNDLQVNPSLASGPQLYSTYFAPGTSGAGGGTAGANATITRGTGATSYQYVLSLPVQETMQVRQGALNVNMQLTFMFKAVANLVPGDVNFDGVVNGLDINAIASNWAHHGSLVSGDANGDGIVNGLDVNMLASNWLHSSAALPEVSANSAATLAPAPEPSTGLIFGVGTCGWWLLRRRARRQAA